MSNQKQDYQRSSNLPGVLVGVLIGSAAGAVAMLLLAPQSGEETRSKIHEKSIELREQTRAKMKDAIELVRSNADKIKVEGREKIEELKQHGQEMAVEQLGRVSEAVEAGKKAIKNS